MAYMGKDDFYAGDKLLELFRTLDYKQQYKACYVFYEESIKYPELDENEQCLKFDEIYESISPDWFEEEKGKIQQRVEVMLDALRDIEKEKLAIFQEIAAKIV